MQNPSMEAAHDKENETGATERYKGISEESEPEAATQGRATIRGCYPSEHTIERMISRRRNSEWDEQGPASQKEGEES